MNKLMFLLIPVLLLSACGPAPTVSSPAPTGEIISGCQGLVDGMYALTQGLKIPEYFMSDTPTKQGGEFAVSQYFEVLNHLSMRPGYALDYVYHNDGLGSYPLLYAYPTSQAPYATEADLTAVGETPNYLDFVQADGTPESYFQYVLLSILGGQFYLSWHANYNDLQLVCDKAAVMATVASTDHVTGMPMPLAGRVRARFLSNIEPRIFTGDKTVEVRIVTFTKWGGFYRRTYTLQRLFPHTILDMQKSILLRYDCGVMF